MLKSSVLGSLAFVPFVLVGCGSDSSPGVTAGANSAGANSDGGAHVNGGSSGTAGAATSKAGNNSSGGEAMGGSDEMAGEGGESAGLAGADSGRGGSSAGQGGSSGHGGTAGGSAGASAGHAGTAGSSGGGGTSGAGGTSGSGGTAGGHAGSGGGTACTSTAQCAGSQVCIANLCTQCDNVAFASGNTVYFVDPVNGSDANGTGSATSGGQAANACAFKTITRALQVIGSPTQASGVLVKLKGNAGNASGESFPISVPQYVVIQGASGPVTVTLASGKVGFTFTGSGSVLKDLLLEGGGNSGVGVLLQTADVASTLDAVTIQNTAATAVDILAGTLTLLSGTTIQMAGTSSARQEGITVEGTGKLVAKLTTGKVSVIKNTAQGIHVLGRGSVDLQGVVTSNTTAIPTSYAGTIVISQNNGADIELNQTGSGTAPLNTIKGILATGSVTSDGLLILGGTAASVRKSVFVGNGQSGIHLSHTGSTATGNNDVSAVDLGKAADPGLNVVQGANDQLNNKGAGICIDIDPTKVQNLSAQGNIFAAADCSATSATLTKNVGDCAPVTTKPADLGWEWISMSASKVTVDVAKCN